MRQVVQQQRNGRLSVAEVPAPMLRPEGLLVRTAYSLISAGTERAKLEVAQKSLIGKALARPDQVQQVLQSVQQMGLQATYQKVMSKLDDLSPLGYSSAGIVIAAGSHITDFAPGDRVACAGGGYANHAEVVYVPRRLCAPVPDEVGLDEAAYATVGAIALQGVRQATVTLGETVGVIGLGLVGLLTVQLLRAAGCRVVGFDVNPTRCALARQLGADTATAPGDAPGSHQRWEHGLDAVLLTAATSSDTPVRLAGQLARDRGRIVIVGAVGLDIPRGPFYDKELDIRFSRSYGPGRYDPQYEEQGVDYPLGYVRWTEERNLGAFLDLLAQHKVDVQALTTHRFAVAAAEQAYAVIQGQTGESYLGVLLEYTASPPPLPGLAAPIHVRPARHGADAVGVAVLGAGNFAQSMLLPHLSRESGVRLRTVVTPSGLSARSVADRQGFEQCASDVEAAFNDVQVNLVLVASRHDSHAALVSRALAAGKAVFVEKPLALTPNELTEVQAAYAAAPAPFVMVGFNRRFAPLVTALRAFMLAGDEPFMMQYRVNAGHLPRSHWTQDPQQGGGRIIGEVCHFVDLLQHLAGCSAMTVAAYALPDRGRYSRDNLTAVLNFADGSVGSLVYAANGDPAPGKERLEVFGGGRTAILDDFRSLTLSVGGRRQVKRSNPDKGHRAEMMALLEAVRHGSPEPIPFSEAVATTATTLAILEALLTGAPVRLAH